MGPVGHSQRLGRGRSLVGPPPPGSHTRAGQSATTAAAATTQIDMATKAAKASKATKAKAVKVRGDAAARDTTGVAGDASSVVDAVASEVSFAELGLDDRLLTAVAALGWAAPTLIQVGRVVLVAGVGRGRLGSQIEGLAGEAGCGAGWGETVLATGVDIRILAVCAGVCAVRMWYGEEGERIDRETQSKGTENKGAGKRVKMARRGEGRNKPSESELSCVKLDWGTSALSHAGWSYLRSPNSSSASQQVHACTRAYAYTNMCLHPAGARHSGGTLGAGCAGAGAHWLRQDGRVCTAPAADDTHGEGAQLRRCLPGLSTHLRCGPPVSLPTYL